ncbi:hypothetical protein LTR49_026447 [Elasticomyces elasticus]|nr:hypothetical protein LTR49_026447 [Elasticomyces elasticus]
MRDAYGWRHTPNRIANVSALRYPPVTTYTAEELEMADIAGMRQYEREMVDTVRKSTNCVQVSVVMVTIPNGADRSKAVLKMEKQIAGIELTFWLLAPICPGSCAAVTKLAFEGPEDELIALCLRESEERLDTLRGDRIRLNVGSPRYQGSTCYAAENPGR